MEYFPLDVPNIPLGGGGGCGGGGGGGGGDGGEVGVTTNLSCEESGLTHRQRYHT